MKNDDFLNLDTAFILNALMENIVDSIYFKDKDSRLLWVSRKMAISLNKDMEDIIGKTDCELFGDDFGKKTRLDDLKVIETGQPIIGLIESRDLENGETNWTSTSKLPLLGKNNQVVGLLGITREINDLKRVEDELQYYATHDILTGIPNRYLLLDRLEQTIDRAKRNDSSFALLYIDLDEFKPINDKFGHDVGDQVLKQTAKRLKEAVRKSDTVARMGGDEFVIILDNTKWPENAMQFAQKICNDMEREFTVGNVKIRVTASVGISFYPKDGQTVKSMIKVADRAMYRAKTNQNMCMYHKSININK